MYQFTYFDWEQTPSSTTNQSAETSLHHKFTLPVLIPSQIIDHVTASEEGDLLRRREGYWQHELMTLPPWGLNTRDELGGQGQGHTKKN